MKISINEVLEEYKHKRWAVFVLSVVILVMMYLFQNAAFALRTVTAIAFIVFFYIVDHFFDIRFRFWHYGLVVLISVSSLLLSPLYFIYPSYDKIQHFIQPMFVFLIIFFMVNKLDLKLKWKITFTFFITAGILGIFELGEFALDLLFDLKLQGVFLRDVTGIEKLNIISEPHYDTMIDLSLGMLGSLLFGLALSLFYRKKMKKGR